MKWTKILHFFKKASKLTCSLSAGCMNGKYLHWVSQLTGNRRPKFTFVVHLGEGGGGIWYPIWHSLVQNNQGKTEKGVSDLRSALHAYVR